MSSNGETSTVLRGVTHGAVDFLIKPVRIEELRNVWQHVVRRKRELVKEFDSDEHNSQDNKEDHHETGRKRKEAGMSADTEHRDEETNANKKPRVTWSVEMHQKFVGAVNQLGVDKAVPKKILDIMNVEGLTRENVASHLQKYRLYLKRVQGAPPQGHVGGSHSQRGHHVKPSTMAVNSSPHLNGGSYGGNGANMANGHASVAAAGSPSGGGSPARQGSPQPGIKTEPGQTAAGPGPVGMGQGSTSGTATPALGPDSFHQGAAQFPGAGGMLNNPMGLAPSPGLNPLLGLPLNPMSMNHMGLGGPLGMPPLPSPLGMLNGGQPGMPGMGPMGMPGMPGMNLNPLNFMSGMGMPPLGMGNNMMSSPLGMMNPGMSMGMGMGMSPQGMGMGGMGGQQGQQQGGQQGKVGMGGMQFPGGAPYMPSTSPMPGHMGMSRNGSLPNGLPAGVGMQGPGSASGAAGGGGGLGGLQGSVGGPGDALEMGDLAGPLGELLQGDGGGPGDMATLLNMDIEGGFPELEAAAASIDDGSLGGDSKDQGNFDELFNLILKS